MANSNKSRKERNLENGWRYDSDSEEDLHEDPSDSSVNVAFLPNKAMTDHQEQIPSTGTPNTGTVLQAVFGAMKFGKKRHSKSCATVECESTPPINGRRRSSKSPSTTRRMSKSPSTKRQLWSASRHVDSKQRVEAASTLLQMEETTSFCKLSDGPSYLFKMAAKGRVKEIASVCNAQPSRILSRDEKGATMLHHAAAQGRKRVIDYLLADQQGASLLEARDETENTPIFWAVVHDNEEAVDCLMLNGADATAINQRGEAPLHASVRHNSMKALRGLLKHKGVVRPNQPQAITMLTPLHVAAEVDNEEAAKLLLDNGAKLCPACQQGYRPLHMAALNGSKKVLKLIVDKCVTYGYTCEQILSFSDKERCSPLHCAVLGGNDQAIKMCLEYGARLDTQQADQSTPMHMVCAQGAYDIVEGMFELASDQASRTLVMQDAQKHTPLHKAAMYGHSAIVQFLAKQGADLDIIDSEQNTPLLLAASRGNWFSVRHLIELGADLLIKNKDCRNFLHMIVLNGGDIRKLEYHGIDGKSLQESCKSVLCKMKVQELFNQPDAYGCTPLHYACQEGNLASLETLMRFGVSAKLKAVGNQSPLHFAARYGRYNACKKLINCPQGPNIINEKDDEGMTPLHYASENGHVKVVQLLLNRGAVCHRNVRGESVLHVTAKNGYSRTIKILVAMNRVLLNTVDEDGNTPLHHAACANQVRAVKLILDLGSQIIRNSGGHTFFTKAIENQNRDVALATIHHDRWQECMEEFYKHGGSISVPSLLLIQHLPDVWVTAMNRCIKTSEWNAKCKDYWMKYEFKYLQPNVNKRDELRKKMKEVLAKENALAINGDEELKTVKDVNPYSFPLPALNKMVQYNRVECLRHPVSTAYLQMKWNAYGRWVHGLNLFIYVLGLIPLTYLICNMDSSPQYHNEVSGPANVTNRVQTRAEYSTLQMAMMVILTILSSGQIVKELVQLYQLRQKYFLDITNAIEWVLYVSTLLFVVPFFIGYPLHWQFECGSVAVLLAWFNLLMFFQRFDISGIYVVMFVVILRTLMKVLALFSFLLIAFSLAFFILMSHEEDPSFSTPGLSLMRIITMTLGEINYTDQFLAPFVDGDDDTLHYSLSLMVLLLCFIVVMPILLMNLLIGLAVGDIAEVQNNAELQRLAMQVQLHTEIEGRLSTQILRLVDKSELTIYPNRTCGILGKMVKKMTARDETVPEYSVNPVSATDRNISSLSMELQKQKDRLKDMQVTINKQHELLRLIVQKMEIRSEADEQDEGVNPGHRAHTASPLLGTNRFGARSSVRPKLASIAAFQSLTHD